MNIENLILSTISKEEFLKSSRKVLFKYLLLLLIVFAVSFIVFYIFIEKGNHKIPSTIFKSSIISLISLMFFELLLPELFFTKNNVELEKAKGLLLKISSDFIKSSKEISMTLEVAQQINYACLVTTTEIIPGPSIKLSFFDKEGFGIAYITKETLMLFSKGEQILIKDLL